MLNHISMWDVGRHLQVIRESNKVDQVTCENVTCIMLRSLPINSI